MRNEEARKIDYDSCIVKCARTKEECENTRIGICRRNLEIYELKAAIKKTAAELYIYQEKARENRDDIIVGECIRILRENTEGLV